MSDFDNNGGDFFGKGDNGKMEQLLKLLNEKRQGAQPLAPTAKPVPQLMPQRAPAVLPGQPAISPEELDLLQQQSDGLKRMQEREQEAVPVTSNDDRLLELIRSRMRG